MNNIEKSNMLKLKGNPVHERSLKRKSREIDDENEDTVSLFNEIGIMYLCRGQNDEAKRSFIKALNMENEENPSKDLQFCLDYARSNEGFTCDAVSQELPNNYQRREYDEGMHVYTSALHTNSSFPTKSRIATFLYNIGQACARSKQYEEAMKWFGWALTQVNERDQCQRAAASVNIVNVQHNLGHCCYRLGKKKEALEFYEEALVNVGKLRLSKLDLAVACNCVGVVHFHECPSDSSKALELFHLSLSIYRTVVGDCNREVGTFLNNIGRVHYMRSEFGQALKVYEEALKIRQHTLGCDSIDVAATMFNTGQTHHERGELDDAMKQFKGFLDIAESCLGANNCDVVAGYKCIGRVHYESGNFKEARCMFELALKSERAIFGEYHPELGPTLNDIGSLCYEMKDMKAALTHFQDGLKVERLSEKPSLSHVVITLLNIAHIYKFNGEYREAFNTYKEAHKLQVEVSGVLSAEVASTLSSMGLMQYLLKEYVVSLEYYQEALQVRRECYKTDEHLDIASTLNSIGLVFFKLKKHELAKDVFMESMRIRQILLGMVHRDVAILWYNIATVCLEMGDEEQAIKSYKESLRLERQTMGEDHPEVAATLQHLGQVFQQRGELDEAIRHYSEALRIQRTCAEESPASICKLLNLIGNIHLMRADVDEMMKCFIEATRISCQELGEDRHSLVIAGQNFYGLSKLHPPCAPTA